MRYLKVMIIDDEMIVREGVKNCIAWEEYGFSVSALVENAKKAIEVMEQESPDVIITDIRMPMMDGLEFIKLCREQKKPGKFIVISGYDDFSYAQSAIRYGVEDYILKPVKEEELLEVLLRIREKYFTKDERENSLIKMKNKQLSRTIREICQIVDFEISNEELSLKWVAENRIFKNGAYLSKQFIKETGYKFSTYLMIKRMERALQLFRKEEGITVYEVAERTGFGNNPHYFSTVFKKYYDKSPSEYKEIPDGIST